MSLDGGVGIPTLAFDHAGARAAFADAQALWVTQRGSVLSLKP